MSLKSAIWGCTMIPSVWKTINNITDENRPPSVFALTEAFMQIRKKFDKEMRASRISVKPFVFRSLLNASGSSIVTKEEYSLIKKAAEMVFKDCEIIPYEYLKDEGEENKINYNYDNKFKVNLYFSEAKHTNIEMIDINLQIWALLRFIIRDEVKVFVRISEGNDDIPLFIDEFEVSPTIIINPLISPLGGYIIKFEKNDSKPVVVDWGTVDENDKEHRLRINTAYYAPYTTPPLDEFKSDLIKELDNAKENEEACNQLVFAIKSNDLDLFNIVLETYPNVDVNVKTSEGKAPIHYAASVGSGKMISSLLDKKADINILTYDNNTALHELAISEKYSKELWNYLIKNGADINIKNSKGKTPQDLLNSN